MSRFAMIFRRETIAACIACGGFIASNRMPSMRYRTRRRFSCGSMWMSDAPLFTAS
jgi:hypothetical protein